jgi:hypothetical protein
MKKKILQAFALSIVYWNKRANGVSGGSCPICPHFDDHHCHNDKGKQCPIAKETGNHSCYSTPFYKWCDSSDDLGNDHPKTKELAAKMRDIIITAMSKEL